ncbi:MAG: hypothetical protein V4707_05320 [Pseudomonadota bacterium]
MSGDRRQTDRRAGSASRDLVPVGPVETEAPATAAPQPTADPAFSAQLMGQTGQKRGLKGGAPVLDAARSAYLGTEYSGSNERRPPAGKAKRTDV